MSASFSGEIVLFGSDVERPDGTIPTIEDREDKREPRVFKFPAEMGAVGVRRVGGSIFLLNGGETYRLDKRKGFHTAFKMLPSLAQCVVDIIDGGQHYLALTEDGQVYSFGSNDQGQLGLGHTRTVDSPTLLEKYGNEQLASRIVQVAAGKSHSIALTEDGSVYTWGAGGDYETGLSATSTSPTLTPRFVAQLKEAVVLIAAGEQFSAAVTATGKLYTWGTGLTKKKQRLPTQVQFPDSVAPIISLAGGFTHIAAVDGDGGLWTWGFGVYGQLGHGADKASCQAERPMQVQEVSDVKMARVFCGKSYTVAISRDGVVYTFGSAHGGKLGHGDSQHQFVPRSIQQIAHLPVSQVGCGPDRLVCFIPTRIKSISPLCAPSNGGITLTLKGLGLYPTGDDFYVRFQLDGHSMVNRAVYDTQTQEVRCQMQSFPEDVIKSYSSPEITPVARVSLSLDGQAYSDPLPLNIYTMPSEKHACLLEPDFGPFQGGTQCILKAVFQNIAYDNIRVKFEIGSKAYIVPATYDVSKGELSFASPAHTPDANSEGAGTLALAQVSVSLGGQKFATASNVFSFYDPKASEVLPAQVGLKGGAIQLTCAGLHFHEEIQIQFTVNGDPKRRMVRRAEYRLKSMTEGEDADMEVFNGEDGRAYLWVPSPDFSHYGACEVDLAVCVNGCDFTDLGPKLIVSGPQVQSLLPACGPVTGGTSVLVQGKHFFFTKTIDVRLENGPPPPPPPAVEEVKDAKSAKKGAPEPVAEPEPPTLPLEGTEPKDIGGEYRDRVNQPVVELLAPPAQAPGKVHVFVAFDPHENAFNREPLVYTYYAEPEVLGAEPAAVDVSGGSCVEITGNGFIESDTMTVRLVEVLESDASVGGKGGGKKAPKGKGGKKDVKVEEPVDANPAPPKVRASILVPASYKDNTPEEGVEVDPKAKPHKGKGGKGAPVVDANAPSIIFTCPPVAELLSTREEKDNPKPPEEGGPATGVGMQVELELSLNGQQFIKTGFKLHFEDTKVEPAGKKPSSGKKKK